MPPKPDTGYNPVQSVTPDTQAPQDYDRAQATPADMGSQIGGALQQLDQTGQRFASQATDVAVQMQQRQNQVAVDDGFNQLHAKVYAAQFGDPNNPKDGGFMGLQGQDALNARGPMLANLESFRQQVLGGMQNGAQKLQFDEASRRLMTNVEQQVGQHANQEWNTYASGQQFARQDMALKFIGSAPTDEATFQNNLADGMLAAAKKAAIAGASTDQANAEQLDFRAKAYATRAIALGATDPVAALSFVKANESNMDGQSFATLVERLTPKANETTGNAIVNRIVPLPGAAALGPAADAVQSEAVAQGVDPIQAQTVAQLETRGGAVPDRPGSQFKGPFQLSDAEFAANGGTQRGDVNAEAAAGVGNLKRIQPLADAAVGGTAQPWQVYLMHQQGDAGGAALLKADPLMSAVDALAPAYGGNKQRASAAILANGGDPNETVGQFTALWQGKYAAAEQGVRGNTLASGPQPYPDMPGLEQKVLDATAGNPELQHETLSILHQRMALVNIQAEQAKADLRGTLASTNAALLTGDTTVTIPEQTIRAAFAGPEADRMVADLNVSKQAGLLLKGLQWAPPEQVAQTMADLQAPDSKLGILLRGAGATSKAAPGDVGTPDASALPPESPDQTLKRQAIFEKAQQALQQRNEALARDPALYVASEPNVKAAHDAIDASDPSTFEAYARASVAAQKSLGVADSDTRLLASSQSALIVKNLMNADPAKTDAGAQLDGLAKQYGAAWPKVFGDLVRAKLPSTFQVLATMDGPDQAAARTELQTAQQQAEKVGGVAKYAETLPPSAKTAIDNGLDAALQDFQTTTRQNTGGQEVYSSVRQATQLLAYSYVARQGLDPTTAVAKAANSIVGDRYDMDGTMRVPKGTMGQVQAATSNVVAALKPTDLAPFGGDPAISQDQRQSIELDAARRGTWVPNNDDSGLILMGLRKNGYGVVRMQNGSPVEVKFSDAARLSQRPSLPMAGAGDIPASQQAGGG